jgi:hypothetical protein
MSKSQPKSSKASKATATPTTVTTTSAKENRERHLKLNNGKPLVPLIGRTYLINAILWSIGSSYDKEAKQMSVPAHVHAAAQTLVAQVEALIPAKPVIIKADAAKAEAAPTAQVETPAKPASTDEADRIAIAIMADKDASEEDLDQLELAVQEKRLSRPVRKLANKHLFALSRAA